MSNRRACCCDESGCTDCFSEGADTICCRLNKKDVLMLKIERPAWSMPRVQEVVNPLGSSCPCGIGGTSTRITGTDDYAAAADILVQYRHWEFDNELGGYTWFTENGSFGVRGSDFNGGYDLWYLWPELCPQQNGTKPACCNISCNCSATTPTYLGPKDTYLNSQAGDVCAQSNENLSTFQKQIIDGGPTPGRLYANFYTCDDASQENIRTLCEFDGYEWLQGIYDDTNNYKHYYWNGSGVSQAAGFHPLARTLVAVYHREKWYKACEKYGPGVSTCAEVQNWGCRVPEYWIYGCAGLPIFSWEIREMYDAGKITQDEYEWFFEAEYTNQPISGGTYGKSLVNKLETSHWHAASDAAGYAILETRDWRGETFPGETTAVPSTEMRIIRKDLARWSGRSKTVVDNQLFHARPGGWTHACAAPPRNGSTASGSCAGENIMSGEDVAAAAPQVPREIACKNSGGVCDNSIYDFSDEITTVEGKCFSASPFPQCHTCNPTDNCNGCTVCGGCTDCDYNPIQKCGEEDGDVCFQDTWEADCNSIHFTFTAYYHDQTNNFDREKCVRQNHAYLWVINSNCEDVDGACSIDACPPGPIENTPKRANHFIGSTSTKFLTCGDRTNAAMCDGAKRLIRDPNGNFVCPGRVAKRLPIVDPDTAPGTAQKGPFDSDGCGRYLCNENRNFPIGACCLANGTCIDAVTEAQCTSCGGTWHGKDSCCLDSDLCE